MEFAVLGPLQVVGPSGPVDIVGAKERALLAHLLAAGGRMVPTDELVDNLWGDEPPRTAVKSLQNYVLRLRNTLEPDRDGQPRVLVTDGRGYRLAVPDQSVDARRFARLVDLGRQALAEGRLDAAARTLAEALALWRGPAYAGMQSARSCGGEARRLEELRVAAVEDRVRADLDRGLAREAVPELEALVHEHPLRERLWHLLVLALYRSGRQSDGLAAYSRARAVLMTELGVEPGQELTTLHAQVLAHDPALDSRAEDRRVPPALRPPPGPFVGRSRQLDELRDLWERVRLGDCVTVALCGPAGSGARRLVSELAMIVAGNGWPVECATESAAHGATGGPVLTVVDWAEPSQRMGMGMGLGSGPRLVVLIHAPEDAVPVGTPTIDLPPLEPADVRDLMSSYLPTQPDEEAVHQVLRESGGVVARVHDSAQAVARRRTHERLTEATTRTTVIQTALSTARRSLTEGVLEFQGNLDRSRVVEPDVCPWKGLTSYQVADAPWFAGRERLAAELLARLAPAPLLAVVGASGSGKSSLVHAGLLASLAAGALPGSQSWLQLVMRPGRHPLRELVRVTLRGRASSRDDVADMLEQLVYGGGADGGVVLVVDQLEEVWTTCLDASERRAFLDALSELTEPLEPLEPDEDPDRAGQRCKVVLAVRADFVAELADHPALARAMADATVLVGAPSEAEVRRAVEQPAGRSGLELDTGLTDALVSDAGHEPGALPLLSTALAELWDHRDGTRLTLAAYVRAGGLRGAVARIAERAYGSLSMADQTAARILLMRLAGPGEADAATRRRVPLAELAELADPRVAAVVAPLADARLLTVGADHVEVAHEALFREWPRLCGWLADATHTRALHHRLVAAAAEWDAGGREASELWRGTRLAAGVEFVADHRDVVTTLERGFVEEGRAQQDAEQRSARDRAAAATRQYRRLRLLLGGLAAFLVIALVAGMLAVQARSRAGREATVARSRALAAASQAIVRTDAELAVLLALEAVDLARPSGGATLRQSEDALHQAVTSARIVAVVRDVGSAVDWSPDGSSYVTNSSDGSGQVDIRDPASGESLRSWQAHDSNVLDVAFGPDGPDGPMLVTTGGDGSIDLWSPRTGDVLRTPQPVAYRRVQHPVFSPDGGLLAASLTTWGAAMVWDVSTGEAIHEIQTSSIGAESSPAIAFSPDGMQVGVAVDDIPVVVDLATGLRALTLAGDGTPVEDLEWSPDGTRIATGGATGVTIWDADTGAQQLRLTAHRSWVRAVTWDADGRLATGSMDGTAKVWDVSGGAAVELMSLAGSSTETGVVDVAFSADGERLLTGTVGGVTTTWDVGPAGDAEWANYPGDSLDSGLDYTPDGRRLVVGSASGRVTAYDTTTDEPVQTMGPQPGRSPDAPPSVGSVDVSPDGAFVASTGVDHAVTVWDAATGDVVFTRQQKGLTDTVSWSPDGRYLATAVREGPDGGYVSVLSRSGDVLATLSTAPGEGLAQAGFTFDGRLIGAVTVSAGASTSVAGEFKLWNWQREVVLPTLAGAFSSVAFDPVGRNVVIGRGAEADVLAISTFGVSVTLLGQTAPVLDVAYSHDGSRIATAHEDGVVQVWDAASGQALQLLRGHTAPVRQVVFSPDGTRLASSQEGGPVRVWALDLDDLVDIATGEVTRGLKVEECQQYLRVDVCPTPST